MSHVTNHQLPPEEHISPVEKQQQNKGIAQECFFLVSWLDTALIAKILLKILI
jgi:hypothetical protein